MTPEAMATTTNLQIYVFSRFRCQFGNKPVTGLEASKAQELLCLLALGIARHYHGDVLADKLWPDEGADAKKGLRQALWQVQSALAPVSAVTGISYLVTGSDWIGINLDANVWVDAVALELTYLRYRHVSEAELTWDQVRELQVAADCYQGDLLEGCYLDFCLQEREHYQFRYLSLLDKLVAYYEWQRDYERGVECSRRILRCDPSRESTHRRLMLLHYLAGDRARALRQFEACAAALKKDLGVEPDHATLELYQMICHDDRSALWRLTTTPSLPAAALPVLASYADTQVNKIRQAIVILQVDVNNLLWALDSSSGLIRPLDLPPSVQS